MKLLVVICGLDCEKSDVYIATKKAPIYVKARPSRAGRNRVPADFVFSNHILEDLERIWELRYIIPDPCNPAACDENKQELR